MRGPLAIVPLLALANVAISAPHSVTDNASVSGPLSNDPAARDLIEFSEHDAGVALAALEKRRPRSCRVAAGYIRRIGTSSAINVFVNGSLGLARMICEDEGYERCRRYITYIQIGYNLIFSTAAHMSGSVGTSQTGQVEQKDPISRRSVGSDGFLEAFTQDLLESGLEFDGVEEVPLSELNIVKRDADPAVKLHATIKGVKYDDEKRDTPFTLFENGDGHVHIPTGVQSSGNSSDESQLGKRAGYHGHAFKMAFTTRQKSRLTKAHQNEMSLAMAQHWANQVAIGRDGDEFIGLVKTEHKANFYYRVIPELNGFGLNYESVDVCGGMSNFL